MYKPHPKIKFGLVYRTGGNVDIKGDGTYTFTLGTPESSSYTQKFPVPATYGIGLAIEPNPKVTIAVDVTRTNWSTMKEEVTFDSPGASLRNKNLSSDWRDSYKGKVGMEIRPDQTWSIQTGFGYDQNAAPDKAISMTKIIDPTNIFLTLGAGYKKDSLKVNAGYLAAFASRTANNVDYSRPASILVVDVGYSF
jgi:long-subunit fatty acid transport protein